MMVTERRASHARKISFKPYLWGMDRFTVNQAVVSLFVGLAFGLTGPFMNIYFLYHLGTTASFWDDLGAGDHPCLDSHLIWAAAGRALWPVRMVLCCAGPIHLFLATLALTPAPGWGRCHNGCKIPFRQPPNRFPLHLGCGSQDQAPRCVFSLVECHFLAGKCRRGAVGGAFLAQEKYRIPLFIAAGSMLAAGVLNELFFRRIKSALREQEVEDV